MTYYECYTVVEGAADQDTIEHSWDRAEQWMTVEILDCQHIGIDAQAYFIAHDHGVGIECECVQYLTDHRPFLKTDSERNLGEPGGFNEEAEERYWVGR